MNLERVGEGALLLFSGPLVCLSGLGLGSLATLWTLVGGGVLVELIIGEMM